MLVMTGCDVLSDFRQKKLLQSLQSVVSECQSLDARFVYFMDLSQPLDTDQRETLMQLLEAIPLKSSPNNALTHSPSPTYPASLTDSLPPHHSFISVPRLGTISPWSTKGTDIVHRCGLATINRVERGIQWELGFHGCLDGRIFDDRIDVSVLESLLYDPMTESVLTETEVWRRLMRPIVNSDSP